MDKDVWNINILKSFKNLETLQDVFTKSEGSLKKFKSVITDFGGLFTSLSGSVPDPAYIEYIDAINEKVAKYNDDGDNFTMKHNASLFINRLRNLEWSDAVLFISEVNAKGAYKFQNMLKEHGNFVDRGEEERKKAKEEEEKRRKLEEERRRMSSIEARPTPKTHKVTYCTVCGAKFDNDAFGYCTQCGGKRHTYIGV